MKLVYPLTALISCLAFIGIRPAVFAQENAWQENWAGGDKTFLSEGRNRYFILEPGHQLVLKGNEDGEKVDLIITVLNETKKIDGVETRVVEERESHNGKLAEVSRNYFAIGKDFGTIYYFGEDVDVFARGKVTHDGSWHSGVDGAKFGVMIPGEIKIGAKYYQERAPKIALDRGENISTSEIAKMPAGEFEHCLKVKETSPLEPKTVEYKLYAPNVGLIRDGKLKLVKSGFLKR